VVIQLTKGVVRFLFGINYEVRSKREQEHHALICYNTRSEILNRKWAKKKQAARRDEIPLCDVSERIPGAVDAFNVFFL